jgi:hypothetical protein
MGADRSEDLLPSKDHINYMQHSGGKAAIIEHLIQTVFPVSTMFIALETFTAQSSTWREAQAALTVVDRQWCKVAATANDDAGGLTIAATQQKALVPVCLLRNTEVLQLLAV